MLKLKKVLSSILATTVLMTTLVTTPQLATTVKAAEGEVVYRTTTFESDDEIDAIRNAEVGQVFTSTADPKIPDVFGGGSKSTMTLVEHTNSRWFQIDTAADIGGSIQFPFKADWSSPGYKNSYTLEATFMFKDTNADLWISLTNANWGYTKDMLIIGKDGNIYARASATNDSLMAARAGWEVDKPFTIKMVCHMDSKSYELYVDGEKVVDNEPLACPATWSPYGDGLNSFKGYYKPGLHPATSFLIDNIKLSGSDEVGQEPVVNPNPGIIFGTGSSLLPPVNYYVSPTGSDSNDGKSPEKPFQTIQKAADLTAPGDTVYLMDGTWTYDGTDRLLKIEKSGAVDSATGKPAYITYKAYPGATPVLHATNGWDVIIVKASYIIIDGLTVKGNRENIKLEDAEAVYDYYIQAKDNGETIDWNRFTRTNTNGINIEGLGRVEGGLQPLHHITVRNCHVYDNAGGGIASREADYVTIENNSVHSNAWYMVWAGSGISVFHPRDIDENTTTYKNVVRNNTVYDNETKVKWIDVRRYSDGNGIIVDDTKNTQIKATPYKGKTLVYNNVSYNNGGSGIHAYSSTNVDIINNTVYNNSRSPHINYASLFASSSEDVKIFNNIIYGRAGKNLTGNSGSDRVLFANNIYYNGTPVVMGPNSKVADPKFVNAEAGDFRLAADSPAVDNGTKTMAPVNDILGTARPQGAGYDIGAYESEHTSTNPLVNNELDIEEMLKQFEFKPKFGQAVKGTPQLDGEIDAIWSQTQPFETATFLQDKRGATAKVRTLWDETNLYILMEVKDPVLSAVNPVTHEQDSVEIYTDENNAKTATYQDDDGQFRVNYLGAKSVAGKGKSLTADDFTTSVKTVTGGYVVEAAIPFKKVTPTAGITIGFDAQVNDDSGVGKRDAVAIWSDPTGASWQNTSKWGNLKLVNELEFELSPVTISPETATFDKYVPADLDVNVDLNGNTLSGIKNGSYTLISGTDYTVNGSTYKIKKEYLSNLNTGTTTLVFDLAQGTDKNLVITVRDTTPPPAPVDGGDGLKGEYFNGKEFDTKVFVRIDPTINFDWGSGSPEIDANTKLNNDNFAIRWTGSIKVPETGDYVFHVLSNDGGRLWINDIQLTNKWADGQETIVSNPINLEAGKSYPIKFELYEGAGSSRCKIEWVTPSGKKEVVPQQFLYSGTTEGDGLKGVYYNGVDFNTKVFERVDPTLSFDWGTGSPKLDDSTKLNADNFSVRWTGDIKVPENGDYVFHVLSNDGGRLWINGVLLTDKWMDGQDTKVSAPITLQTGRLYPIKFELYEGAGSARCKVEWVTPSGTREVVPQQFLLSQASFPEAEGEQEDPAKVTMLPTVYAITPENTAVSGVMEVEQSEETDLVYAIRKQAGNGTVEILDSTKNQWKYTPNQGFVGVDSFEVKATDADGNILARKVNVHVNYAATNLTYYVSIETGSDDNDGLSDTKAFKTIKKAAGLSRPGDTILIMNGRYDEGEINIARSGLPGAYITYTNYPGHKPVINPYYAWSALLITGSYIRIEGLTIEGNKEKVTYEEAKAVYDMIASGASMDWAAEVSGYTNQNGISIRPVSRAANPANFPHHVEIRNCEIFNNSGGGIAVEMADYITIENNLVHGNCNWDSYATSGISIFHSIDWDDNTTEYKTIVKNNISYNNQHFIPWAMYKRMSDGNGIIIDDNKNEQHAHPYAYLGRTLVENNILYDNGAAGINVFQSKNVDVFNNTSYNNNLTPDINYGEIGSGKCDNVRIMNNIMVASNGKHLNQGSNSVNVVYDYNVYFNGTPTFKGENDIVTDPLFVDVASKNFNLKAGSPALDSGNSTIAPGKDILGTTRPQGSGVDRGAIEKIAEIPGGNTGGNTGGSTGQTPTTPTGPISNTDATILISIIKNTPDKELVVDVTGNKIVAKEVFDAIKGTDKVVIFEQGGLQWSFSGKDITETTKVIDMTVRVAPLSSTASENKGAIAEKANNADVMVISFAKNGKLPGKATVKIKLDANWLVNKDKNSIRIYYYNETAKKMETVASGLKVTADGYVEFEITHNSDYIVTDKDLTKITTTPTKPTTVRLGGASRYETSVKVSQAGWTHSDNVVLARGDEFADALCAAPFAKQLKAPVLLTSTKALDASVIAELKRLKTKKVYIIGGTGAISASVENAVKALGITVERISGTDRYATSLAIANRMTNKSQVFLVTGTSYADALSISSYAAATGSPIILTAKNQMTAGAAKFIKDNNSKVYVIGGNGVISDSVVNSIINAERISGSDRYATNLAVLNKFASGYNLENVYLATGANYPDAICGSALAGKENAPIILVNSNASTNQKVYVKSIMEKVTKVNVLGGEGVLSPATIETILN